MKVFNYPIPIDSRKQASTMSNIFNILDENIDENDVDPFSKDYERLVGKESWADYMDLMDNPKDKHKKKLIPIPLFRSKANN